jgi:threonine dehydrogenase-like Zn-dependent dehydrogenase
VRAAVLRGGRMVTRDDVPEPAPGPGQVLVAVKACGICGSDLHFASHGEEMMSLSRELEGVPQLTGNVDLGEDVFMGHEFSAEVLDAGLGTDAPPPGTQVTSFPVLLSGAEIKPIVYSNSVIGGYAEKMLLSAPLLLRIPNGLDPRHAALTEPMAVGRHAVNKSGIERAEHALVLGCGPIGLAVIASLRARGVEMIAAADFSPKRRELAAAMGAHQVLDPADGPPFDTTTPAVVFEAIGLPGIIDDCFRRAPAGARIVVVGVCMQADTVHPFFASMKEISVQFVFGSHPKEFADTLRSIAEGEIDVAPMVTGEVDLDGVGTAFHELADPERHCKILVTP